MANGFISALDKVGEAIRFVFTNKTAEEIEQTGLAIGEVAFPAVAPLLGALQKSIATAQGLAANVPAGLTVAQMTALVVSDAQAAIAEYESATGTTIESVNINTIIGYLIQLLQNLPGSTVVSTSATPSVSTQAASGTLL